MKRKFYSKVILALMCVIMSACSSGGANSEGAKESETAAETKEEYTISTDVVHAGVESMNRVGGTGVIYGWGYLPVDADDEKKPEDGIVVVVNFTNVSESPEEFQHFFWIKAFQGGVELDDISVYSDVEFKPLDNWNKSVMGGATIQVAKSFELNDESPVTIRLYEQIVPDNFVEVTIDPTKKEDSSSDKKEDSKKDDEKEDKKSKKAQQIEKELTSVPFWELVDPTDEYYYSSFTFKADGTGFLFEQGKYDFTWTITDKDTIQVTYKETGNAVDYTLSEDSDGSYFVNSENPNGLRYVPIK